MSSDYYQEIAKHGGIGKGEPRKRRKGREKRQKAKGDAGVRQYVFARERDTCRVCRCRADESRHELVFKSLGGKVTRMNCVAVCGDGVFKCHGLLQRLEISWTGDPFQRAEGTLVFTPCTRRAADWLKVRVGESIESRPMVAYFEVTE